MKSVNLEYIKLYVEENNNNIYGDTIFRNNNAILGRDKCIIKI